MAALGTTLLKNHLRPLPLLDSFLLALSRRLHRKILQISKQRLSLQQPNGDEINGGIPSLLKGPCARILSIASFSSMCPFALFEYLTIVALGRRWLLPGNLLDVGAILLQIFLFTCQMCLIWLTEPFFGVLLAIQCVFLCVKLQNYGRLVSC